MKQKATFLLSMILFYNLSFAQKASSKIGIVKNGGYIITSSLKKVKSDWAELLKSQEIEDNLIDYSIVSGIDSGSNNKKYYILVGKSIVNTVKVATRLKRSKNVFYLPNSGSSGSSVVTCTGKIDLPSPEIFKGNWICGKSCTKDSKKIVTVVE